MSSNHSLKASEATSTHPDALAALADVMDELVLSIGPSPDVAVLFLTSHHASSAQEILREIYLRLSPDCLTGCTVMSVVGGGREHQAGPGLTIWAARMPGSRVQAFHVAFDEEAGVVTGWPDVDEKASAVFLADPFSFPLEPFFASLRSRERFPALVGGIASGANRAGGNLLFCDTKIYAHGGVGFVLKGGARIEPLVSQGCRPVGDSFRVTASQRNQLLELGGRPAYESLREVVESLGEGERHRFMNGPQVGIQAVRNRTGEKGASFLVRSVVGVDAENGTIALGDVVRDGAVLQFHTRDAETAHEDFDGLAAMASSFHPDAAGALMFLCTGRGVGFFHRADHDIETLQTYFPGLPTSGFFAAGEIGPICGLPYVHGLTACVGLLVPQEDSDES